jgi:hypothetical protein
MLGDGDRRPRPAFYIPEDAEIADPPTPRAMLASPTNADSSVSSATSNVSAPTSGDLPMKIAAAAAAVHKRSSSKDKASFASLTAEDAAVVAGHRRVGSSERGLGFASNLMGYGTGGTTTTVDDAKYDFYKAKSSSNPRLAIAEDGPPPDYNPRTSVGSESTSSGTVQVARRSFGSTESKASVDDSAVEQVRQKKLRVWNSTSTLFVKTTMSKPDVSRSIRW